MTYRARSDARKHRTMKRWTRLDRALPAGLSNMERVFRITAEIMTPTLEAQWRRPALLRMLLADEWPMRLARKRGWVK